MSIRRSNRLEDDHATGADVGDRSPDLDRLRALAEREEFAEAVSSLADGYGCRLSAGDPLALLARDIACSLVEAGFTLHHCARYDPLYRLGGVCLLPVTAEPSPGDPGGVVVSWTTHDLLSLDWDRGNEYHGAHEVMNGAFAKVLDALGYQTRPFGGGGAWIVTGHRPGWAEAGQ